MPDITPDNLLPADVVLFLARQIRLDGDEIASFAAGLDALNTIAETTPLGMFDRGQLARMLAVVAYTTEVTRVEQEFDRHMKRNMGQLGYPDDDGSRCRQCPHIPHDGDVCPAPEPDRMDLEGNVPRCGCMGTITEAPITSD